MRSAEYQRASTASRLASRAPASPKLRLARFDDYPAIAALATRYRMPPEPRERWMELWVRNPAYSPGTPIGWILHTGSEVVGWFANIPLHYELRGELLKTATPRSWVMDERFRAYASLMAHTFLQQGDFDLLLSTTANESAGACLRAAGGKPVPQAIKPEASFWISDYRAFAEAYLRWKHIPDHRFLAGAAGFALRAADALGGSLPDHPAVERSAEFDARFDTFWQDLRRVRWDVLLGLRNRVALDWHFGAGLRGGKAWLYTYSKNGRMVSYAVFLRSDNVAIRLRRMFLADFQELEESSSALPAMINAAIRQCAAQGLHSVEILGSRLQASAVVQKLSRHTRPMSVGSLPYLYNASGSLASMLNESDRWDLTLFDGDSSLWPTEIDLPSFINCPAR